MEKQQQETVLPAPAIKTPLFSRPSRTKRMRRSLREDH